MTLTVGNTLQHGRYAIDALLHQDDVGISYQAQDFNLDRVVLIQTPSVVLGDRPDAADLTRQFIAEARHRSKAPASDLHVLDCFVENELPYVVMAFQPGKVLPSLALWLAELEVAELETDTLPSAESPTADSADGVDGAEATVAPLPLIDAAPAPALATPEREETTASSTVDPAKVPSSAAPSIPLAVSGYSQPASDQIPAQIPAALSNGAAKSHKKSGKPATPQIFIAEKPRRSRHWIPLTLMATATVGGFAGALFGWQIRQGKSLSEVVPVVGPQLNTEQSFPPIEGWPVEADRPERLSQGAEINERTGSARTRVNTAPAPAAEEPLRTEPYGFDYDYTPPPSAEQPTTSDYAAPLDTPTRTGSTLETPGFTEPENFPTPGTASNGGGADAANGRSPLTAEEFTPKDKDPVPAAPAPGASDRSYERPPEPPFPRDAIVPQ